MNIQNAILKMLAVRDADIMIEDLCQEKFQEKLAQNPGYIYKGYRIFNESKLFVYYQDGEEETFFVIEI